jgi:hypothetical protein
MTPIAADNWFRWIITLKPASDAMRVQNAHRRRSLSLLQSSDRARQGCASVNGAAGRGECKARRPMGLAQPVLGAWPRVTVVVAEFPPRSYDTGTF